MRKETHYFLSKVDDLPAIVVAKNPRGQDTLAVLIDELSASESITFIALMRGALEDIGAPGLAAL